ncbi:molybdate ABC transporter substrate-binding protein [Patulibacter sp. S7RM1-6]
MSTLAVELALQSTLLPAWRGSGREVEMEWNPTGVLLERVRAGERADVLIAIDGPIAELVEQGVLRAGSARPIARASFGLGVKQGARKPDISTPERFREALLSARSVAYSLTGASGIHFQNVMERLDITSTVGAKATAIRAGFTAERVTAGEADLAVQQVSELMAIDGIDVVGPFPAPYQQHTDFSAALFADSDAPAEVAEGFLAHLSDERAADVYLHSGLLPRTRSLA